MSTGALLVVDPGPLTTVQDGGRPGHAHEGVPPSGALDRGSWRLANRLVGNHPGAAALEATLAGPRLVLEGLASTVRILAVTGAPGPVSVGGREVDANAPVTVRVGQEIVVGPALGGTRRYLALSGGMATEVVLGSRSTDLLSGLGPPALRPGDRLPLGSVEGPAPALDVVPVAGPAAALELRVLPGPRHDWLTSAAWDLLCGRDWLVRPESNRVGLRLDGPSLSRTRLGELPPEGVVTGSIQVPRNGSPVLFLADHPVTGGYPIPAVVVDDDLDAAGQAAPGTVIRFRRVGPGTR
jgi:biotin-dependent carboxylase-like uncharacterized protein